VRIPRGVVIETAGTPHKLFSTVQSSDKWPDAIKVVTSHADDFQRGAIVSLPPSFKKSFHAYMKCGDALYARPCVPLSHSSVMISKKATAVSNAVQMFMTKAARYFML